MTVGEARPTTGLADARARERLGPLVARIRSQAAEFVARDPEVRDRLPEGVHQMRVAVRRLRSVLKTFRPAFDPDAAGHLRDELKWIGDLLGAERDAEVIALRIARDLDELPPGGGLQLGLPGIANCTDPHAALNEAMDSIRYRALVAELAAFAISPPFGDRERKRQWLVSRLVREIQRAEAIVDEARASSGDERDALLHEVRKASKQIRYAAETLTPTYGTKATRVASAFEEIQTALGEHHDAIVTAKVIANERHRLVAGAEEDAFGLGVLFAREEGRAAESEAEFNRLWARSSRLVRDRWPHR